jgi:hypothetical protein
MHLSTHQYEHQQELAAIRKRLNDSNMKAQGIE